MATGQDEGGFSYAFMSRGMAEIAAQIAAAPTQEEKNAIRREHASFINAHMRQFGPDYDGALPVPAIPPGRYTRQPGERKHTGTGRSSRRLPIFESFAPSPPEDTEPLSPYVTGRPPMRDMRREDDVKVVAPPGRHRSRRAETEPPGRRSRRLPVFERFSPSLPVETEPLSPYVTGRPPMRDMRREDDAKVVAPPGGRRSREAEIATYWQNRASAEFNDGREARHQARRGRHADNEETLAYMLQGLEEQRNADYSMNLPDDSP
jgi:hypothetical protein